MLFAGAVSPLDGSGVKTTPAHIDTEAQRPSVAHEITMSGILLASLLTRLMHLPVLTVVLWTSLAVSTVAMLVVMRTRWGRLRPTHRYVMLSVVAHLMLICVATTIHFASLPAGDGPAPVKVRIVMRSAPVDSPVEQEAPSLAPADEQEVAEPAPAPPVETPPAPDPEPTPPPPPAPAPAPSPAPAIEPAPLEAPPLMAPPEPALPEQPVTPPQPVELQTPPPVEDVAPEPSPIVEAPSPAAATEPSPPVIEPVMIEKGQPVFAARDGEERWRRILEEGGDSRTEDAVAAALAWLATAQSHDGRWDASRWAAGRERGRVLGHTRTGIGMQADTAMTGLALLAMMGAGHTHQEGPFAENIRSGLSYLLRTQGDNGNLFGEATFYAQTYCHSMATFALSEALATTGDRRLEPAVRRAVNFLAARQDRATGGWRYRGGDPGDMSQLGWILMSLRSAEIARVDVSPRVWEGIERFLRTTQRGANGGRASYRPNSTASHSMTAESFYCRQILGRPIPGPTSVEAVDAILRQPPSSGRDNYYAWYYATLALHHHRHASISADGAWRTWNDALKQNLVQSQVANGQNRGSWSPNTVWGGCGGRVYTTALATMCLEVYYRYDPSGLTRDPWIAAREYPATLR